MDSNKLPFSNYNGVSCYIVPLKPEASSSFEGKRSQNAMTML